jgi:hypothetical protein
MFRSVRCPVFCAVIARSRFGVAFVGRVSLLRYEPLLWHVNVCHRASSDHLPGISSVPTITALSIQFSSVEVTVGVSGVL